MNQTMAPGRTLVPLLLLRFSGHAVIMISPVCKAKSAVRRSTGILHLTPRYMFSTHLYRGSVEISPTETTIVSEALSCPSLPEGPCITFQRPPMQKQKMRTNKKQQNQGAVTLKLLINLQAKGALTPPLC